MYEHREELTKEFVLSRISEEDIFNKYMNIYPNLEQYFTNPLREDTFPDCKFYRDSRGVLKFKDFAYKMNIDCFNLVQLVDSYNIKTFNDILRKIATDFNLYEKDIDYRVVENWKELVSTAKRSFSSIRVKRKDWTKQELQWWKDEGVSRATLDKYKISSLQYLWLNNQLIYEYRPNDPGYVQQFGEGYDYKAYFPLRTKFRFIQNIGDILQGYEQLPKSGEALLIIQSNKAGMAVSEFDIPVVAPLSESVLIAKELFDELKERFPIVFTLFDRDRAGMYMSQLMRRTYGTIPLLFDAKKLFVNRLIEPKDWNEHQRRYGLQYMLDAIDEIKGEYLL